MGVHDKLLWAETKRDDDDDDWYFTATFVNMVG